MEPKSTLISDIDQAAKTILGNKLLLIPLLLNWMISLALELALTPSIVKHVTAGRIWSPELLLSGACTLVLSLVVTCGISYSALQILRGAAFSWSDFWVGVRRFFFPFLLTSIFLLVAMLFLAALAGPIVSAAPIPIGLAGSIVGISFFYLWQVVMVSGGLNFSDTMDRALAFLKRHFWRLITIGGGFALTSALCSLAGSSGAYQVTVGQISPHLAAGWPGVAALIGSLLALGVDLLVRLMFFTYYQQHS